MKLLQSILPSFHQSGFYRNTINSGTGTGFGLIFLLALLGTLFLSISAHFGLRDFLQNEVPSIVAQIPDIEISNGIASTPEPMRYEVWDQQEGELIAIIDTRLDRVPADTEGSRIFLTAKEMVVLKNTIERRTYDLGSIESIKVDQPRLHHWMMLLGRWGAAVALPFILIGLLIGRTVQWLFFSIVAIIALKVARNPSNYSASLRLTALAMTPPVLIDLLLSCLAVKLPFSVFLFGGLVVAYILFGSLNAREQSEV